RDCRRLKPDQRWRGSSPAREGRGSSVRLFSCDRRFLQTSKATGFLSHATRGCALRAPLGYGSNRSNRGEAGVTFGTTGWASPPDRSAELSSGLPLRNRKRPGATRWPLGKNSWHCRSWPLHRVREVGVDCPGYRGSSLALGWYIEAISDLE